MCGCSTRRLLSLLGGEGDDILTGGPGVDAMVAGSGDDTVILKGFPADTPKSFPVEDPDTGGRYENPSEDCEVVLRG